MAISKSNKVVKIQTLQIISYNIPFRSSRRMESAYGVRFWKQRSYQLEIVVKGVGGEVKGGDLGVFDRSVNWRNRLLGIVELDEWIPDLVSI
jgi:hypothetical protein